MAGDVERDQDSHCTVGEETTNGIERFRGEQEGVFVPTQCADPAMSIIGYIERRSSSTAK